jgi:hypothetical protein
MTARTLDPQVCDRLIKLLGMTGSKHGGERAAAGLKANELLRRCGLRWDDVICVPCAEAERDELHEDLDDDDADWGSLINQLYAARHLLRPRDRHFVESMLRWEGEPTPAQKKWLLDIWRRRR